MCGRYTQTKGGEAVAIRFECNPVELGLRYNQAPGQGGIVVTADEPRNLQFMHWGLLPQWMEPQSQMHPLINARAETLSERKTFRDCFTRRRCLVPADGFYEWAQAAGTQKKQPYLFRMKDNSLFAFAGLWDRRVDESGNATDSYCIITTPANSIVEGIHDRMPAILKREDEDVWMDPDLEKADILTALLKPYPVEEMKVHPVSPKVNSADYDQPDCIEEYQSPSDGQQYLKL